MVTPLSDSQRALVASYHSLRDASDLLYAQYTETTRLLARLDIRKVALLRQCTTARQNAVPDELLAQVMTIWDLDAEERVLTERGDKLLAVFGRLQDQISDYTRDESTGYWRVHRNHPSDLHGGAKTWWIPLVILLILPPALLLGLCCRT